LDGVQYIGVLGGAMFEWVAAVGELGGVPELEESDGDVAAVGAEGDSGAEWEWGWEGEAAVGVLVEVLGGAGDVVVPGGVAGAVAAVDAVDAVGVGVCPGDPLAGHGREVDVGVEVDDPVVAAEVGQAVIDGAGFGELVVSIMHEVCRAAFDAELTAEGLGVVIVGVGDDDVVIEMAEVVGEGLSEEVGVVVADGDGFDALGGNGSLR